MDRGDENAKKKTLASSPKCSMTFRFNVGSNSRAKVLYNSLRVDQEPRIDARELTVDDTFLIVNLTSSSISNLRASCNGILENLKTLTDVIEKFEISEEYDYCHF